MLSTSSERTKVPQAVFYQLLTLLIAISNILTFIRFMVMMMIGVGESTITVAHVDAMILTLTGSAEGTKCVLAFEAGI